MKFTGIIFFIACCLFSHAQNNTSNFPQDWEGIWAGQLEVYKDTGLVNTLPMELHILPIDSNTVPSWTWTIIYGADKEAGRRSYELIRLQADRGHYLIDEKNSIKMEAYYLGGAFYQWFEVGENRLLTTTKKIDNTIVWEIVFGSIQPVSTTGDSLFKGEEIPPVLSYPVSGLQKAVLTRQD